MWGCAEARSKLCGLTLLAVTVLAFFANFEKFWSGGQDRAEVWNLLASAAYLAAWGWFLWEKRSKKALWFARVWWGLALFAAVAWFGLQYLYFPEFFLFAAWPLGALCLSLLFGLNFLLNLSYGGWYLVCLVICAGMLGLSIRRMKRIWG